MRLETWYGPPSVQIAGLCRAPWQLTSAARRTASDWFSRYESLRQYGFPVLDKRGPRICLPRGTSRFAGHHARYPPPCAFVRESDIGRMSCSPRLCQRASSTMVDCLFIDLRDHYGLTQGVADPDSPSFKEPRAALDWWSGSTAMCASGPTAPESPDASDRSQLKFTSRDRSAGSRRRASRRL